MVDSAHVGVFVTAAIFYTIATILLCYLFYTVMKNIFGSSNPEDDALEDDTDQPQQSLKDADTGYKWMIGCNACGLCSFTFHAVVSFFILWIVVFTEAYRNQTYISVFAGTWVFYLFGLWTMLFIFVSRIDNTFKNSFLAYPPIIIRILYGWTMIIAVLMLVAAMFNVLILHNHLNTWLGPLILVMHFFFSMTLMYLLCKKVFQAVQLRMIQRAEDKNDNNKTESETEEKKYKVDLMSIKSWTRFMMLAIIGIFSSYIGNIIVLSLDPPTEGTFHGEYSIVYAIDLIINGSALYFLFEFNNNHYYTFCGSLHDLCERCCIQCAFNCVDKQDIDHKTKEQCTNLILSD